MVGEGEALRIGVRLYVCPAGDGRRLLVLIYPFEAEQQALDAVLPILESLEVIKHEPLVVPRPGGRLRPGSQGTTLRQRGRMLERCRAKGTAVGFRASAWGG